MTYATDDLRRYCEKIKEEETFKAKKEKREAEKIESEMTDDVLLDLKN